VATTCPEIYFSISESIEFFLFWSQNVPSDNGNHRKCKSLYLNRLFQNHNYFNGLECYNEKWTKFFGPTVHQLVQSLIFGRSLKWKGFKIASF
jgi:hypothetical protein